MICRIKKIDLAEAVQRAFNLDEEIYTLSRVTHETQLCELYAADAFCAVEVFEEPEEAENPKEEKPEEPKEEQKKKPKKNEVDHGRICACYKAGWSVAKIADECQCSDQTVRNHLKQEGLMRNVEL